MLISNKEALLDLLRTNSVGTYLVRRSNNRYVAALRELLNALGYSRELQYERLGPAEFFGEETALALRTFASRNNMGNDGLSATPALLLRMLLRLDAIDGIKLLQRSLRNRQLDLAFNLNDPNNYGTQQLHLLLENLGIYEENIRDGLHAYALQKRLAAPAIGSMQLSEPIARAIVADLLPSYGESLKFEEEIYIPPVQPLPTPVAQLDVVVSTDFVAVSDGSRQIRFRRHSPVGISTPGLLKLNSFVDSNVQKLNQLDLTPSALSVMKAVSRNEGNLDGINTYDRGFLSLGIYQWTLGRDDRMGELPALLKKVKALYPATFDTFFRAYGIDVSEDTNTTYGYLTHNGIPVSMPFQKDQFREPELAFRFWRAAQESDVQAVQVEHALSRLKNFYWKDNYTAMGFTLNQLITSSYGVALLLDNHVNRPAWVAICVENAMRAIGLTTNPGLWTDQEELQLINAYLMEREQYSDRPDIPPMTASRKRADMILMGVREGWLSDRRGSFQMSAAASLRSFTQPSAYDTLSFKSPNAVAPPPFYSPKDYPDIEMEADR